MNEDKSVFTSKADCGICLNSVVAIDLEEIDLEGVNVGGVKLEMGKLWACNDCRREVKELKQYKEDCKNSNSYYGHTNPTPNGLDVIIKRMNKK